MARFSRTTRTTPARFKSHGDTVEGTVLSITDVPVPVIRDGQVVGPKKDAYGKIVMQTDLVVDAGQDGNILVHTRGGVADAIADALDAAKAKDLHEGDFIRITYTDDEEMGDDLTPARVFEAEVSSPKGK